MSIFGRSWLAFAGRAVTIVLVACTATCVLLAGLPVSSQVPRSGLAALGFYLGVFVLFCLLLPCYFCSITAAVVSTRFLRSGKAGPHIFSLVLVVLPQIFLAYHDGELWCHFLLPYVYVRGDAGMDHLTLPYALTTWYAEVVIILGLAFAFVEKSRRAHAGGAAAGGLPQATASRHDRRGM